MIQNLILIIVVGLDPKPKLRKESTDRSKFRPCDLTQNISFQINLIFLEKVMGSGPGGVEMEYKMNLTLIFFVVGGLGRGYG